MNVKTVLTVLAVPVAAVIGFVGAFAFKGSPHKYTASGIQSCLKSQGYSPTKQTVTSAQFTDTEFTVVLDGNQYFVDVLKDSEQANKLAGVVAASNASATGTPVIDVLKKIYVKDNVAFFPTTGGSAKISKACL